MQSSYDNEFDHLHKTIISHQSYVHGSKHQQIRINSWIQKLETITSNMLWRKNRNNYMRLLYLMLEYDHVLAPFTHMVPNEIPTLQKH